MARRVIPGPRGRQGPPGPGGSALVPWDSVQWVNGASVEAPITGSISAPQTTIDGAIAAVDDGGSIYIGAGDYALATLPGARTVNFYGLGGPQGNSGDNARVTGFAIGVGAHARLDSLTLLDDVNCSAPGGTLYCSNVSFNGFNLNAAGWAVRIFSDGLETGNVLDTSATLLLSEGTEHDGTITVTTLLTLRDCVLAGAITCDALAATGSVFDTDVTATTVASFVDCWFTDAITVTSASILLDALSYTRAIAAGVTLTGAVTLTEGSTAIANQSGVAGATVTAALNTISAFLTALDSSDIANASGVAGATVTAALNTLDGDLSGFVPTSRTITAGAGLTGGGSLAADRTINAAANADGSIVVNADDIQVGVLASDAQHGNRGGGAIHAAATTLVAGFLAAADKVKIDNMFPPTQGANLTDANVTIQPNAGTQYNLPAGTYTANRVITWGTTGAVAGLNMGINIEDVTGFEKQTVNGGAGGGVVVPAAVTTALAGTRYAAWAQYDGTNWNYTGVTFI